MTIILDYFPSSYSFVVQNTAISSIWDNFPAMGDFGMNVVETTEAGDKPLTSKCNEVDTV